MKIEEKLDDQNVQNMQDAGNLRLIYASAVARSRSGGVSALTRKHG